MTWAEGHTHKRETNTDTKLLFYWISTCLVTAEPDPEPPADSQRFRAPLPSSRWNRQWWWAPPPLSLSSFPFPSSVSRPLTPCSDVTDGPQCCTRHVALKVSVSLVQTYQPTEMNEELRLWGQTVCQLSFCMCHEHKCSYFCCSLIIAGGIVLELCSLQFGLCPKIARHGVGMAERTLWPEGKSGVWLSLCFNASSSWTWAALLSSISALGLFIIVITDLTATRLVDDLGLGLRRE